MSKTKSEEAKIDFRGQFPSLFNDIGSMTALFYGIKNDTDRHGFEVRIGCSECALTDPVLCLKDYKRRSNQNITERQKQPVFITLLPPFKALSAQSVGTMLRQSIADAGLDESFTPPLLSPDWGHGGGGWGSGTTCS